MFGGGSAGPCRARRPLLGTTLLALFIATACGGSLAPSGASQLDAPPVDAARSDVGGGLPDVSLADVVVPPDLSGDDADDADGAPPDDVLAPDAAPDTAPDPARDAVVDTPSGPGRLRVLVRWEGAEEIDWVHVGVARDDGDACNAFRPDAPPDGPSIPLAFVPGEDSVLFTDLAAPGPYMVWVAGRSRCSGADVLFAAGCADDVPVASGSEGTLKIRIHAIRPSLAGTYDLRMFIDASAALPPALEELAAYVTDLLGDADALDLAVVRAIREAYVLDMGPIGSAVFVDFFVAELLRVVPDHTDTGPWVRETIGAYGATLRRSVSFAELHGTLTIDPDATGDLAPVEHWDSLSVFGPDGCSASGSPYPDPCCGRVELRRDSPGAESLRVFWNDTSWSRQITSCHRLAVGVRDSPFAIGELADYVLREVLVPTWGGRPCATDGECGLASRCVAGTCEYHSLEDAARGAIDCQGIADGVDGDALLSMEMTREDVARLCLTGRELLVAPIATLTRDVLHSGDTWLRGEVQLFAADDALVERAAGTLFGCRYLETGACAEFSAAVAFDRTAPVAPLCPSERP